MSSPIFELHFFLQKIIIATIPTSSAPQPLHQFPKTCFSTTLKSVVPVAFEPSMRWSVHNNTSQLNLETRSVVCKRRHNCSPEIQKEYEVENVAIELVFGSRCFQPAFFLLFPPEANIKALEKAS